MAAEAIVFSASMVTIFPLVYSFLAWHFIIVLLFERGMAGGKARVSPDPERCIFPRNAAQLECSWDGAED
jgi:hypothetical protein